jgi:hypothetical protein
MNKRKTILRASLLAVIVSAEVIICALLYGEAIAGKFTAWQENQRLRSAGADPHHVNPPAQSDSFTGKISPVWAFDTINGGGLVGHAPEFHSTSISMETGLIITQYFDPYFEQESPILRQPASQRYNNASLIGFQGYQPTPGEDVLFQARMQVSPNFYGSAGFVLQPQGTVLKDGNFQGRFHNQAFTFFGIGFIGPESNLFGKSGTTAERVINWWPEEIQGLNVDMHEPHTYLLRLHWVDEQTWQGIIAVDGQVASRMTLPPFGPVEVHLWSDNYALGTSFSGTPIMEYQNGTSKWLKVEKVSAWVEAVQP